MAEQPHDPETEPLLYHVTSSDIGDVMLTIYFMGMLASGIVGLIQTEEFGTLLHDLTSGTAAYIYSASMVLVATCGVGARLADSRMGEFYAIIGVATLTVLNAALLLPEHPQTAIRLGLAPFMMLPYGWMRLGYTISRRDVNSLHRAIADKKRDDQP